jgi:hypothetical protein
LPPISTENTGETPEVSDGALTEESATDAFLARWEKKDPETASDDTSKKPTEEAGDEPSDKADDKTDDTSDESPEEKSGDDEKPAAKKFAPDDDETYVKVKEGDNEHEVPVKDLKRLWGQEAALTRKSQEVAEARKQTDANNAKALAGLNVMLKRAQERAAPYKQIDFLVAAKQLSAEDLTVLRDEAQRALEDERFLGNELDGFMGAIREEQNKSFIEQAKACVKTIKDADSPHHIPNWDDKLYTDLRTFAVKEGMDQQIVNSLVDPAAIKLLHMAMQWSKGQAKAATTKVNKTPKKIVKSSQSPTPSKGTEPSKKQTMAKLRETGSTDDAAEALLARWATND